MDASCEVSFLCDIIAAHRPFVAVPAVYSVGDLVLSVGIFIAIIGLMRTPLPKEKTVAREVCSFGIRKFRSCDLMAVGLVACGGGSADSTACAGACRTRCTHIRTHPDEFLTVGYAFFAVMPRRTLNPRFYNYPSLFIYLAALAIAVAFGYHAAVNLTNVYLAARVVAVVMGTAAVAATYWAGKTLYSAPVGLVAASMLCVAPIHVQHSHFATVDVPSTLFVACAGLCGADSQARKCEAIMCSRGRWRGSRRGQNITLGWWCLSVIAAHFLRVAKAALCALALARSAAFIVAFVVSTPGGILWTDEFLHGVTYEIAHAGAGTGWCSRAREMDLFIRLSARPGAGFGGPSCSGPGCSRCWWCDGAMLRGACDPCVRGAVLYVDFGLSQVRFRPIRSASVSRAGDLVRVACLPDMGAVRREAG